MIKKIEQERSRLLRQEYQNTEEKLHTEAIRKKRIVMILCLAVCAVLIFSMTRMKYTTPEMRGKVSYEPALFNTVLLGKLVQEDINKLSDMSSETYTLVETDNEGQSVSYTQSVTGKKLAQSLTLSTAEELGDRQTSGDFAKVAPGDTDSAYIPFTITNGTTVADDTSEENPLKIKNVAESDIRYTIHIRTTENLPLSYAILDVNTNKTYPLRVFSDELGEDTDMEKDYVIANTAGDTVFHNGSRLLKCNEDGSISVHQYKLMVSWPATGTDGEGHTIYYNDLKYMKELENIEILVEVESYVNHIAQSATADLKAQGIMVVQSAPVAENYYPVKGLVAENAESPIRALKTVRFDNLNVNEAKTSGDYTFYVCNGDSVAARWVADSEEETSPTRKENGHTPMNGHYTYSGTYLDGNYGILLAVPVGKWDDDTSTITLTYNGETYTGQRITEEKTGVFTTKRIKELQTEGNILYKDAETKVYELVRFYRTVTPEEGSPVTEELQLEAFTNQTFQSETVTLTFGGNLVPQEKIKDDFKIYVYKK